MKLTKEDYKLIREYAMLSFMDRAVPKDKPHNFMAICYADAVMHLLVSKGYKIEPPKTVD